MKFGTLLAAVGTLVLIQDPGGLAQRTPGSAKIEGEPPKGGEVAIEPAFPQLRFNKPLYIGHPGDGTDRLFVIEQDGRIHMFDNKPDVPGTQVVLDIASKVYRRHGEEGLLGMAFHPDYEKNRFVFVHYSANPPRRGVVSRFKTDSSGRFDPSSEKVILQQEQPYGNHNGGDLQFGPDGFLYITFGDGGSANDPHGNGQNLGTWLAKILRIDVDQGSPYSVPPDNPFVKTGGARPEIWAYGLRNIWRFSFDRATGTLWGGDIGQNLYEEIDIIEKGGNYGWNAREGTHEFRGGRGTGPFKEPVIDFSRSEARSITGGYVYRGRKIPGLTGAYLYGDYETGNVWALRWDGSKVTENKLIGRSRNISSFGEDRDGEIYFCSFDGQIYKFASRGGGGGPGSFPMRLSETGLFADTKKRTPHASLIPYDVSVPVWADGVEQERFVMLPGEEKIRVREDGRFEFPRGTIFVKTLSYKAKPNDKIARPLETQVLANGEGGWRAHAYVWDDTGADAYWVESQAQRAYTVEGARRKKEDRTWTTASPADCLQCHSQAAGGVLGFRSEQLDREFEYPGKKENQLDAMVRVGVFEGAPAKGKAFPAADDPKTDLETAVRAYLEVNCAGCHQPGGRGMAGLDLRFEIPLAKTGMIFVDPDQGDLGVKGAKIVAPGRPEKSVLHLRMTRTDEKGMPRVGRNVVDAEAAKLVERWIKGLKSGE